MDLSLIGKILQEEKYPSLEQAIFWIIAGVAGATGGYIVQGNPDFWSFLQFVIQLVVLWLIALVIRSIIRYQDIQDPNSSKSSTDFGAENENN